MATLKLHGETKPIKESLKARGWKWLPLQLSWSLTIDETLAARIRDEATRKEALLSVKARKLGCITLLDDVIVFRSPTYVSPVAPDTTVHDEYDLDAAGNVACGKRIPGSIDHV